MIILGMADLHGRAEMLPHIDADTDLIAFCGDLHNLGSADRARPVAEALAGLGPPVLIVPGNMDPKEIAPKIWKEAGLGMIHRGSRQHGDCGFVGFGGTVICDPRPLEDANRYHHTDEEIHESLTRLYGQISDSRHRIVLTHQPPRNSRDLTYSGDRSGSVGLRRFVEERQPDLLICGHIHEDRGVAEIGSTKVVNVGEMRRGYAAVIELNDGIDIEWIEP
ncbi:metallophosphoesterase family protein [Methanocrinis sp.]|uniref:metallophosphoesterase family protein n=1 Tax=Methanocrinis sp. TaxID=3101522 RepID=UPI003D0EBED5